MSKINGQSMMFTIHAMSKQYHRRVDRLRSSLAFVDPDRAYVSFSAGKDSSILAHVAHEMYPGIPIVMVDAGVPTHWTVSERDMWSAYAKKQRWNYLLILWNKWGSVAIQEAQSESAHRKAAHKSMFDGLLEWADREGRDQVIMGIRAEESKGRRASLATHGELYQSKDGRWRIAPLGMWTWLDVWAYIITNRVPWLQIYDHLGPQARNGLIGRNGVQRGRMVYLRSYFPKAYRYARDVLGLDYARET